MVNDTDYLLVSSFSVKGPLREDFSKFLIDREKSDFPLEILKCHNMLNIRSNINIIL